MIAEGRGDLLRKRLLAPGQRDIPALERSNERNDCRDDQEKGSRCGQAKACQCRQPLGCDVDVQGSPRQRKSEVERGRTIAIAEDQSYSRSETNDSNDQNTFHVSLLFRRTLLRIGCAFLRLRLQRLHWQMLFNCAKGFGLKGGYLSFRESMNWSGSVPPYFNGASGSMA